MQRNKQKKRLKHFLSVVVPAYMQERTIMEDLAGMDRILSEGLAADYNYEIICVVDGRSDGTEEEAKKVRSKRVKVLGYEENRGKGYAVRYGMKRAKGDLISFIDAGRDISPKGIMMLVAHMDWYDADIIVGSKRHPVSKVNYPLKRHIFSIGYHWGVKVLFGLPLKDTQSGIKIFRRKVIEKILPKLVVERYAMDIEMLAVARHCGFERIYEAPIEVRFDKSTSLIDWRTVLQMVWDTLGVFYRLKILRYYN